jgi:hypothetical protein
MGKLESKIWLTMVNKGVGQQDIGPTGVVFQLKALIRLAIVPSAKIYAFGFSTSDIIITIIAIEKLLRFI